MTEREDFAPLIFFEYEHRPGSYCLLLSDAHMVEADGIFTECGQSGHGYGWTGVARSAVRSRAPDLEGRFGYDPEAGTFVAYGEDPEALRRLGSLLRDAFHDPGLLRDLIRTGDPSWFD
ncbi:immunity 51 family protein [Streptomyces sp. DSM 44917]|uniref:Immunity 51 family protein n=1 Tax=Streptomyces boetiae TaxID=3075541 RepID=A0ABU2LBG9_9ACTN|nr:immunity 51 family protein [Streptomyces sp. DSM 44917]MDT0308926.1 immunity 51 family protein [Streptomyces sp. DSM 44917]